ncbi:Wobble nucleotide-excising tRNase [Nitrosospira briensis]|uniref:Wobble nucleotide-excising tRNase n=1 Tax=Nitrosospira briensis TaxID=35799 RepID=A0A1I5FCJ5_9PROT|nr:AAA family ATPase [Nitrosospira briensis]SFO21457.1 Wobble nucleotide-excising tRNase [Nitrosospira briensis]
MLKKIIYIKNVGRFRNSQIGGDTSLAKYSFIFGANGFGKTTICSILRSLKTTDAGYVLGRKTLGVSEAPSIDLLTSNGNIRFNGSAWSVAYSNLAIFDGIFISQNVHSGDVVDIDQKRNLYRVIIGEAGVSLAEQELKLAGEGRAKTTEISNTAKAIQTHLLSGIKLESFIALPKIDDMDEQIAVQESRLTAIREATTIKTRPSLARLELPALPDGFTALLAKTIGDITKDAEHQINVHLAAHGMTLSNGANWIVQGIDHSSESCPFCGQAVDGLSLITAYQTVFSDSYKALRGAITAMKVTIDHAFGDTALARLDTLAEQHKGGIEFWSKYCQLDTAALDYPASIASAIKSLNEASLALIERKIREPLEAILVDDVFMKAMGGYEVEKEKVDAFNQAVHQANALITAKKTEVGTADFSAANAELARMKAVKTRHSVSVAKLCDDYSRLILQKTGIENQKMRVRQQLELHTRGVVKPYQQRINDFLDAFNAGFRIAETKHTYAGGIATSSYQLIINQTAIDIGGGNTPHHIPSFKNTLSAGDRSTLALAFFLAHLKRDGSLANKIVVFDDPFNSQDAFRRRQTIHEIVKIAGKCVQVLVLSHDAAFLKLIWEKCPASERAALTLADHGQFGSKIAAFNLEKACQGRTATDIDDLQAFVTNGAGKHIDIIRKMRTVLETYMLTTYPLYFDEGDWLGEVVRKIRESGSAHSAAPLYDELNQINDYTAQYHHGENFTDATPDQIDPIELGGFSRRTLRIVNALQA